MNRALLSKIASKVLSESLGVREGEAVTIETWNNGLPFATRVVMEARRIGAIPLLILEDESTFVEAVNTLPKERMGKMGKQEYSLLSKTDAYVFIPGPPIIYYYRGISPSQRSDATAYNLSWYEAATKAGLRGVRMSFGYVGQDMGGVLGKAPPQIINHILRASIEDYGAIKSKAEELSKWLEDGDGRLISKGSLEFIMKGKITIEDGIVDDSDLEKGQNVTYIPPGVISKQIDPASVSGSVLFDSMTTRYGFVRSVRMTFDEGRLVSWNSRSGTTALEEHFKSLPEDKRVISSFDTGLNRYLKHGFSLDRFVAGGVSLTIGTARGVVEKGSLNVGKKQIVKRGVLL